MKTQSTSIIFLLSLLLLPGFGLAKAIQSSESIQDAIKQYLSEATSGFEAKVSIDVSPLDSRLALDLCEESLETFSPTNADFIGKTTVGVRCAKPSPWTVYVSAYVSLEQPVVVMKRDLARGDVITSDDIELAVQDTSHLLKGFFDGTDQVQGKTVRRTLRRGQVVTPGQLVEMKSITRGQKVSILAGRTGIEVRMQGKALDSGNPGDLITVQNLSTKKKFEAKVVDDSTVRVD